MAPQAPPARSGRRVIFLTLDEGTGPLDATFFEDVQGPHVDTVFHSWMLLVRGVVRRTGPRGASLRATGAWDLTRVWEVWQAGGEPAVRALTDAVPYDLRSVGTVQRRRALVHLSGFTRSPYTDIKPAGRPQWRRVPRCLGKARRHVRSGTPALAAQEDGVDDPARRHGCLLHLGIAHRAPGSGGLARSLDEAFLDLAGVVHMSEQAVAMGRRLRAAVSDEQSITCLVGVAPVKFVAKLASTSAKPAGLRLVE